MAQLLHTFLKKYKAKSHNFKRKQWLKSITHDLIKTTPIKPLINKYALPIHNWNLGEILNDNSKKGMCINACYVYTNPDDEQPLKFAFPLYQYLKDEPLLFIDKFILPHINFYISIFDDRIMSFIDTLHHDIWRMVLLLLLSLPVVDTLHNKVTSINQIYLDEDDCYVVERVFPYSSHSIYKFCCLFGNIFETLSNVYDVNNLNNFKFIQEMFISIHLKPFKEMSDSKLAFQREQEKHKHKYLSLQFYVPKAIIPVHAGQFEHIDNQTSTFSKEKTKRIS